MNLFADFNWVCWAIIGLALVCYQQLWTAYLTASDTPYDQHHQQEFARCLVNSLPLLGLLGTIIGLLNCFANIASQVGDGLLSQGIADALFTTQLGLVCAIPGWLMLGALRRRTNHLESA